MFLLYVTEGPDTVAIPEEPGCAELQGWVHVGEILHPSDQK